MLCFLLSLALLSLALTFLAITSSAITSLALISLATISLATPFWALTLLSYALSLFKRTLDWCLSLSGILNCLHLLFIQIQTTH